MQEHDPLLEAEPSEQEEDDTENEMKSMATEAQSIGGSPAKLIID